MLHDLYAHQEWADAQHWRAIEACPAAASDPVIHARLHHIHLVQWAFLWIVRGEPVVPSKPEDFADLAGLRRYAREYHKAVAKDLPGLPAERLGQHLTIPWFKDPPIRITVEQALYQAAMHSHYHRGQNATRVRDLGGEPPLTDLIVWYWKGRPAPEWP